MRLRFLAIATAVVAGVVSFAAAPAQAGHSWSGYHWSRTGQVSVNVYRSVTSGWTTAYNTAISDWNASAWIQVSTVAGATDTATRSSCPMVTGAVRVCNYAYGSTGWSGLASINVSGSHITRANAKMNDTYLGTASAAMRQLVMCQEIGHDWGLAHQDENFTNPNLNTCMDYTNNPTSNQHPNTHDYNQLAAIYNHSGLAADADYSGRTLIRTGETVTMVTWNE
ncbi:hypothetical protein AB0M43_21350 [Longispora sp. NPDC051575]|uniref:hypothetical protein n=1 Tax=Longispora sp. NPDC051575 TaxID=3154943 RepID=UPI003446AC6B